MIATILVEYRRAVAAARHYDHLRLHREPAIRRRVTSSRNFYLRMDGGFERPLSGPRRRGHDANDTV
jgi:hypothetical protein